MINALAVVSVPTGAASSTDHASGASGSPLRSFAPLSWRSKHTNSLRVAGDKPVGLDSFSGRYTSSLTIAARLFGTNNGSDATQLEALSIAVRTSTTSAFHLAKAALRPSSLPEV